MKIHITGAEIEKFGDLYKIHYHDEIIAETTDRWRAIMMSLNKDALERLFKVKHEAMYNNSQ